jgi:cell pole-organizing protein PopZ
MEEILASIRRIIADDDASKAPKPPEPAPKPAPPPIAAVPSRPAPPPPPPPRAPVPPPAVNKQEDIDAMMADLDAPPMVAPRPAPPPPMPAVAPPDVLDLTEAMAAPPPPASFRTIDGASDVVFAERSVEPPPPVRAPEPPAQPVYDHSLISNATVAAVDNAFNSLAHTVLGNNARTLEDLVKEMLRPLLKSWLDDNLPGLVDRIVRAEIERVSRGR